MAQSQINNQLRGFSATGKYELFIDGNIDAPKANLSGYLQSEAGNVLCFQHIASFFGLSGCQSDNGCCPDCEKSENCLEAHVDYLSSKHYGCSTELKNLPWKDKNLHPIGIFFKAVENLDDRCPLSFFCGLGILVIEPR